MYRLLHGRVWAPPHRRPGSGAGPAWGVQQHKQQAASSKRLARVDCEREPDFSLRGRNSIETSL